MANKNTIKTGIAAVFICLLLAGYTFAQPAAFKQKMQAKVDSLCAAAKYPGLSVALVFPDDKVLAVAAGMADSVKHQPMKPATA